jgi:hypothetical protein
MTRQQEKRKEKRKRSNSQLRHASKRGLKKRFSEMRINAASLVLADGSGSRQENQVFRGSKQNKNASIPCQF